MSNKYVKYDGTQRFSSNEEAFRKACNEINEELTKLLHEQGFVTGFEAENIMRKHFGLPLLVCHKTLMDIVWVEESY